ERKRERETHEILRGGRTELFIYLWGEWSRCSGLTVHSVCVCVCVCVCVSVCVCLCVCVESEREPEEESTTTTQRNTTTVKVKSSAAKETEKYCAVLEKHLS